MNQTGYESTRVILWLFCNCFNASLSFSQVSSNVRSEDLNRLAANHWFVIGKFSKFLMAKPTRKRQFKSSDS